MRLLLSLSAAAACLACSLSANADPILSIRAYDVTSGGTAIALSSSTSSTGSIAGIGSDSNFGMVSIISTGAALSNGGLSTTTLNATGTTGSTLLLEITQTGLTATQAAQLFNLSYTLNALSAGGSGTAAYTTYVDGSNATYGTADALNSKTLNGASTVASYTTTATGTGLTANGLYSETQYIQINFAQAGSISASSQITPTATPEPSSLALLGTGLLGIAGMARRRFSRS